MADIPSHHMIYGTLVDYLSGQSIVDTDDERYRQKIARFLVTAKGYSRDELIPRLRIETLFNHNFVVSTIDLVINLAGQRLVVLRYGPGSLVTRERSAIAAARVLHPEYQIPYAVVTNGEDAEFLETGRGQVLARGLAGIPTREEALSLLAGCEFASPPAGAKREREFRILNTFDQEECCVGGACALPSAREGGYEGDKNNDKN
ncbi:MAG: type I restriction enzyme HsdR N-terminal domain-containing protein [Deltaproteobacteria bacterium]|nr:type I restriction enzyme HsdR N-terminal domain-containing protein [Deltaproteobacteria bacterium]